MTFFRVLQPRLQPRLKVLAFRKALQERCAVRQFLGGIFVMTLRASANENLLTLRSKSRVG